MPPDKEIRKLAAIMHADVKGYSRLMGEDESYTVRALRECRQLFAENIGNHGGRVVNAPGDSILAEFPSVVSAVRCAVEIQEKLEARNADLPDNRRMAFRIGVNLGDVIQSEDAIYGDGVNIAARIEALAEPGTVYVSSTVYSNVHNKLNCGYEFKGEHEVKNIAKPVRVYKVLTAPKDAGKLIGEEPKAQSGKWIWPTIVVAAIILSLIGYHLYQKLGGHEFEPASVEKMAYPLPEKPSIAVLPFDNMSGDPAQEYFSDGITEEIITALSKVPELFVIARNSSFTFKGVPVKIQQVSQELGVRYVLEGSVKKADDQVRVTAQLIDAIKGHHLWADRYDSELTDIFRIQDEITKKIISSIQVQLTRGEYADLIAQETKNLEAYLYYLQAGHFAANFNKEDNSKARQLAEKAISLDPSFAAGYATLAQIEIVAVWIGASKSPKEALMRSIELSRKSIALQDSALPHSVLAVAYVTVGKYEAAIEEGKNAVAMAPNYADAYFRLGHVYMISDMAEEAIAMLVKAIRLNPFPPSVYIHNLAWSYYYAGQYEKAIEEGEKAVRISPKNILAHRCLICAYMALGREAEAREHAAEVLKIDPNFSVDRTEKISPFKNKDKLKIAYDAYRKAGLK